MARQPITTEGAVKSQEMRLDEYRAAIRANRQLALALQAQGLNEDAARFAYRAQVLQKTACWFQTIQDGLSLHKRARALGSWLFSWFLFLLAGYGYKPLRSFLAYLLVIASFATTYYLLGLHDLVGAHHLPGLHYLSWYEAVVVSMTAFHGRGFFVGTFSPGDPQALVAAIEAFLGLLIKDRREALVADPLPAYDEHSPDQRRWAVFCAAAVEWFCTRYQIPCPSWVHDPHYTLTEPWFFHTKEKVKARLLVTTPDEFQRRNIFCGDRCFLNKWEWAENLQLQL